MPERDEAVGTGTLLDAVEDAARRAGLDPADLRLEEYPARKRFRWPRLFPRLPSFGIFAPAAGPETVAEALGWEMDYLRLLAEHNGDPLLVLPPDALPDAWLDAE